jgi:hypothetical protein
VSQRTEQDPKQGPTHDPGTVEVPALWGERLSGVVFTWFGPWAAGVAAAIGLLAAILVPIGGWRPQIVLPLVVIIALALIWVVRLIPTVPAPSWTGLLCVAIAIGHGCWAALTHADHIVLRRDAGSYALYTQWIATHHGLPVTSYLKAFGGSAALTDPAFRLASPAFFQVVHGTPGAAGTTVDIVPQFLLGAPAVFSLGWWTDGWTGLLVIPAIVSAIALLAVAGLASRLCGPRWAPVVIASLALSQPVLHAARSTYSEPLALLFVAAAAALLVDAVKHGNVRLAVPGRSQSAMTEHQQVGRVKRWLGLTSGLPGALALSAGLAFGLAGLDRVDAVREVSVLFPIAAVLALRNHPASRPLIVGALGGTVLAVIPAVLLSRPYLGNVAGSLLPLLAGAVVLAVGSLAAVRIGRHQQVKARPAKDQPNKSQPGKDRRERVQSRLTMGAWLRRWPRIVAGLVLFVGVVLATRPLWMTVHQDPNDPGSRVVAGLQLRQGLPVDGGRTYAEHSVNWIAWYLGPAMVVAGWLLLCGLSARLTRWWLRSGGLPDATLNGSSTPSRTTVPIWFAPALIGIAATVLTLYRPGITPDHPWADRRMVPLVLPTFVIGSGAAVAWTGRWAMRKLPASLLTAVLLVAMAAMLVPPWLATEPVAGQRTEQGEVGAVTTVCSQLRPNDVVVGVDDRAANEWPEVVRGVCGRPSASVKISDPADGVAAVHRITARITAAGGHPVLLAATPAGYALLQQLGSSPVQVVDLHTTEDQRYLTKVPDGADPLTVQVWLATL